MIQVTCDNLVLGAVIIDDDQNKGVIRNIDDLHNVDIEFYNGGAAVMCFVKDCEEYIAEQREIPIYYFSLDR